MLSAYVRRAGVSATSFDLTVSAASADTVLDLRLVEQWVGG